MRKRISLINRLFYEGEVLSETPEFLVLFDDKAGKICIRRSMIVTETEVARNDRNSKR